MSVGVLLGCLVSPGWSTLSPACSLGRPESQCSQFQDRKGTCILTIKLSPCWASHLPFTVPALSVINLSGTTLAECR